MTHATELNDESLETVIGGGDTCPEKPKLREKNPYTKKTTEDTSNSSSTQSRG